eukprot:CAMPEP_0119110124 /NCGR_PEP_ID=MMETSP1180-20130426/26963_1 /TAXON_ID=3052 ORGANISM="Chlamydomonas cf sp, Strain CCMP681" /NCGR_SAMPLE_ID=MMETSP1180 /ASSEMBLY_ACC=CAM_ASM_000741 /LENGTH=270 /DNA_ID=CAMNT_0007096281 /DNA_START=643 /DNA_END=1455 /DNA_ORIENTATION=-
MAAMAFRMTIVSPTYNLNHAHSGDLDPSSDAKQALGLSEGLRYNASQVATAVDKGYLRHFQLVNRSIQLSTFLSQHPDNEHAWFQIARPDWHTLFSDTRCYYRRRIAAMAVLHDSFAFKKGCLNIVMHVRRGDIVNINYSDRIIPNSYFIKVGLLLFETFGINCSIHIISDGEATMFHDFTSLPFKPVLHLHGRSILSFLMMYHADIFVPSVSAFSHVGAELGTAVILANRTIFPLQASRWRSIFMVNNTFSMTDLKGKLGKRDPNPCTV